MKSVRSAFTLIEAMVAAALIALSVTGTLGAYGALTRAQGHLQEKERMQRLAIAKYDQLVVEGIDAAAPSGDFADWNESRYEWRADVLATGVDGLDSVRITVQSRTGNETVVQGLVYTPLPPAEAQP